MTLEQRVAKLERQNRWLRRGGAVLAVAFVVLAAMVPTTEKKDTDPADLEVRSLTIKEAGGATCARLWHQEGEGFRIGLWEGGRLRASLGVVQGCPSLTMWDASGTQRTELFVGTNGAPSLFLRDASGKLRASFDLGSHGEPALALAGVSGKLRASLFLGPDGEPRLSLSDKSEEPRASFGLESDGAAGLYVRDGSGKTRASIDVLSDGVPALTLHDAKGKVIWKAPGE